MSAHVCGRAVLWHDQERPGMRATCECGADVPISTALFAADSAAERASWALGERLYAAIGLRHPQDGPPWAEETWDYYDDSLELHGCAEGWVPPPELLACVAAMGFRRMWACYADGKHGNAERYYYAESDPPWRENGTRGERLAAARAAEGGA